MYTKVKRRVFAIIQPSSGSGIVSKLFDWLLIGLIVLNVILVILDTFSGVPAPVRTVSGYIETISVAIFTVEYILRLWTSTYIYTDKSPFVARVRYAFSFMAIVDLLAIMPFYLPFIVSIDLRVLRMLRLLRMLRVLKVNRYTSALFMVGDVLKRKATQLLSSMFVVLILMVVASLLMYNIESEAQPDVFQNAFSGMWWAVATLTTVGYGDIYPITVMGKVLSAIIALLGIGLVAVPTGIISAGFMEYISEQNVTQEPSDKIKHYCPYCGKKLD